MSNTDVGLACAPARAGDGELVLGDAEEGRAPRPWLALRADYLYEEWERTGGLAGRPTELKTHRLPLGANVFLPFGWSASVTAAYVDQEGVFVQGPGSDTFWVVDLALKYRLPKRYGFVSAGVRNAGDEQFSFYDLDTKNPQMLPDRMGFIQITLAFP